jgi:hypothetical protein
MFSYAKYPEAPINMDIIVNELESIKVGEATLYYAN